MAPVAGDKNDVLKKTERSQVRQMAAITASMSAESEECVTWGHVSELYTRVHVSRPWIKANDKFDGR